MKTGENTPCREFYAAGMESIRRGFAESGDGIAAARSRATLVDQVIQRLYRESLEADGAGPEALCAVALGGYGRSMLFPHSDVDLMFLSTSDPAEASWKADLAALSCSLWDLRLRLGETRRTPAECSRLHRDNLEFNIALLDARFLAGDRALFHNLKEKLLPGLLSRERQELTAALISATQRRHGRFGNTIFHLEPNLKDAPGGLRDYQVARWLLQIAQRPATAQEEIGQEQSDDALAFLSTARCLLHYRRDRDDNHLTYELQEEGAGGARPATTPGDWMRQYFRHARSVFRHTSGLLERTVEETRGRGSLYGLYQDWRSRLSSPDFAVSRNRIYVRQPGALEDPALLFGLFELMARHGLELSGEAEVAVTRVLDQQNGDAQILEVPGLWRRLRPILTLPQATQALRAMHALGLLTALIPELAAIDCLVVRDFYHRYTVDEHTFQAIEALHRLAGAPGDWERLFGDILDELEQPDLLYLSLLLHDLGKGMPGDNHIQGSLQAATTVLARLGLERNDQETVLFLVGRHLEMSATLQRRDIFDPETIRMLATAVGSPERLKMLCLMTYADIKAVNPEALTPWKAEMLWRLYVGAYSYLSRSVDEERIHAEGAPDPFLDGFPRRYVLLHSKEEIAAHREIAAQLAVQPVQVQMEKRGGCYDLTVMTADRPRLFASITGTLAAWGMSIIKADAFANSAGIILDTLRFTDLYRTLEQNPGELERLRKDIVKVLDGRTPLDSLLAGRTRPKTAPKVRIATQIRFDDESSSHSTLLEIVTADRPGLLYEIAKRLADLACNIEVALIDTEGQKVIDVFYLTHEGAKLGKDLQDRLRAGLEAL